MRLSILIISLCWAFGAHASVEKIEAHLSKLKTMTANFTQESPDGTVSTGKFFLKRPKKMRWQYNPPTPILMVTRGDFLTYYDYELNQVSDIPVDLLNILSRQNLRFNDADIIVAEQYEKDGFFTITLEKKDKADEGSLGMTFAMSPKIELKQLAYRDATGQTTHTLFSEIQQNPTLADKLFEFKDPRTGGTNKKYDRLKPSSSPEETTPSP